MAQKPTRRELLTATAGATLAASAFSKVEAARTASKPTQEPKSDGPKKALLFSMLPEKLSVEDRFKLARDVGFAGVESYPIADAAECERMRKAADSAGVRVHSVIYGGWDPPLSHPDANERKRSVENARAAIQSAARLGADAVLLVPAVVNQQTRYQDAYKRAQTGIRALMPTAESANVTICVEEVWNNFLLSPLEYSAFVDSFHSPRVQSYFDVGNVVMFAWPEDWIRTVGRRIRRVHLKDYKGGPGLFGAAQGHFTNLRDGSINWPEVRRAFAEIHYTGWMTTELAGGDETYLRDVSARVDKILAGI